METNSQAEFDKQLAKLFDENEVRYLQALIKCDWTLKPMFSTMEAAKVLGVTQKTVRRWCERGLIPAIKLPGKNGEWRISGRDLKAWMEKNQLRKPLST